MLLLNTSDYTLHDSFTVGNPEYAILSHRWEEAGEITFQTLNPAQLRDNDQRSPPLDKIKGACAKAREQSLGWIWIDNLCINHNDTTVRDIALSSMFEWYQQAKVCYAFLRDVAHPSFMSTSKDRRNQYSVWFERGWTLQELLAPEYMEFYDCNWKFMGTKEDRAGDLERATGIDKTYLNGQKSFRRASVATRMSWMAGRTTTYPEDIAYSLFGVLNVKMPTDYGEGAKAFMRLQQTLMQHACDESLFAWTIPKKGLTCYRDRSKRSREWAPKNWGLLAPSPDCFKESRDLVILSDRAVRREYQWTQQAVQIQMPMKSGTEATNLLGLPRSKISLSLNCWRQPPGGKPSIMKIELKQVGGAYTRVECNKLEGKEGGKPASNSVMGIDQLVTRGVTVVQPDLDMMEWPLGPKPNV